MQYNFRDKYNILDYFKSEQIIFKHILCLMLLHKTNVSKHSRVRTSLAFPFCLSILSLFKQIITFWVWLSKTYVLSFILWLSTIKLWQFHIKRKPTAFTLSCYCNLSNAFLLFKASRGSSHLVGFSVISLGNLHCGVLYMKQRVKLNVHGLWWYETLNSFWVYFNFNASFTCL